MIFPIDIIIQVVDKVIEFIKKLLPDAFVQNVLFGGKPTQFHKTKFFFQKLVDRYEASIATVNRTFILNAVIIFFVTYPYFSDPDGVFKIPFTSFEIRNSLWIKLAPLITLFAQLYFLTSLIWFQILRRGLYLILQSREQDVEDFADIRKISLSGILGIFYLLLLFRKKYTSNLNLIWYQPLFILALVISLTPLILSVILIFILFKQKCFLLGIAYTALALPICILAFQLIKTSYFIFIFDSIKSILKGKK